MFDYGKIEGYFEPKNGNFPDSHFKFYRSEGYSVSPATWYCEKSFWAGFWAEKQERTNDLKTLRQEFLNQKLESTPLGYRYLECLRMTRGNRDIWHKPDDWGVKVPGSILGPGPSLEAKLDIEPDEWEGGGWIEDDEEYWEYQKRWEENKFWNRGRKDVYSRGKGQKGTKGKGDSSQQMKGSSATGKGKGKSEFSGGWTSYPKRSRDFSVENPRAKSSYQKNEARTAEAKGWNQMWSQAEDFRRRNGVPFFDDPRPYRYFVDKMLENHPNIPSKPSYWYGNTVEFMTGKDDWVGFDNLDNIWNFFFGLSFHSFNFGRNCSMRPDKYGRGMQESMGSIFSPNTGYLISEIFQHVEGFDVDGVRWKIRPSQNILDHYRWILLNQFMFFCQAWYGDRFVSPFNFQFTPKQRFTAMCRHCGDTAVFDFWGLGERVKVGDKWESHVHRCNSSGGRFYRQNESGIFQAADSPYREEGKPLKAWRESQSAEGMNLQIFVWRCTVAFATQVYFDLRKMRLPENMLPLAYTWPAPLKVILIDNGFNFKALELAANGRKGPIWPKVPRSVQYWDDYKGCFLDFMRSLDDEQTEQCQSTSQDIHMDTSGISRNTGDESTSSAPAEELPPTDQTQLELANIGRHVDATRVREDTPEVAEDAEKEDVKMDSSSSEASPTRNMEVEHFPPPEFTQDPEEFPSDE